MPDAVWKGFLRLSLVSCPVSLAPATSDARTIRLDQLNSRTGNPVISVRPLGKYLAVSGNDTSARLTNRPITRLVNPGTAFGSITTTGVRRNRAAMTGGPATYPPILNTAED